MTSELSLNEFFIVPLTMLLFYIQGNFKDRSMPNVFQQFIVFLKREVILQLRNIKSLLLDMFLVLLAGGVLGALYSEV